VENPYAILGLAPGASMEEIAAAYRALAKQTHPDVLGGDPEAMTAINAAYAALREESAEGSPGRPRAGAQEDGGGDGAAPRRPSGSWLSEPVRRALGTELLGALQEGEPVTLVAESATWASPHTLLALTDRRLLWLLDDAVVHRVRSLRLRDIRSADYSLGWPRRRRATLHLRARDGRKLSFAALRPSVAARIARAVGEPA